MRFSTRATTSAMSARVDAGAFAKHHGAGVVCTGEHALATRLPVSTREPATIDQHTAAAPSVWGAL
jgi:hypothetical protein